MLKMLYLLGNNLDMISFAIFILSVGVLLVFFSAYRSYFFNKLNYSQLNEKLRAHRRLYSYMNNVQRNSRYGKGVYKSIGIMEMRLTKLEYANPLS